MVDNVNCRYEAGAGRISSSHPLLLDLINEMGMTSNLIEIPTKKKFLPTNDTIVEYNINNNEKLDTNFLIDKILKTGKRFNKTYLESVLFIEFILEILSADAAKYLLDAYGYTAEFLELNAFDALRLFKNDFSSKNKFFVLEGGLSTLVDKIKENLKGVEIIKRTIAEDFSYNNGIFNLKTRNLFNINIFSARKLVFATNKMGLLNIESFTKNKRILNLINSVEEIPMSRIYAIFPKVNGSIWFSDIGKITTNGLIQYIIPINLEKGIIMISYPDMERAIYWKNVNINGNLEEKVMEEIRKMFPNKTIPDPKYIKMHFWNNGVHYFKPNNPSYKIADKILKPYKSREIYITGEAYSYRQAWIEGALETSKNVLDILIPLNGGSILSDNLPIIDISEVKKHNTVNDAWTVIDNYVLNITDWIPRHPGGKIILNSLGKDITSKWWEINAHSMSIVKNIFPKYVIGKLK